MKTTYQSRLLDLVINQPGLIRSYNNGTGGVDLLDQLSPAYQPSIRGKNGIGHCLALRKFFLHLEFRRKVVLCLYKVAGQNKEHEQDCLQERTAFSCHNYQTYTTMGFNYTLGTATRGRCECASETQNATFICMLRGVSSPLKCIIDDDPLIVT
ncbi:hypothetical protein T4B_11981 [Trichinella pseudospiralis]|uniref:PiggyBac transposable element-derived protein domain-containing protein n=1 Tax=Trichinella pseudospiralis TaxID=6337 RepID=A0A0V1EZD4_TRIPS|nr:hypothetical protein T4A_8566 [Trichinella pseudospiralis]KRZ07083.1 hypothetical protein T4B_11981 [Trichinella pseudospiralis]